jgi:hypothetical protein
MNGSAPLAVTRLVTINTTSRSLSSHNTNTQFSQTQIDQTSNFFKMLLDLNYYSADEENYIAEQPSGSNF